MDRISSDLPGVEPSHGDQEIGNFANAPDAAAMLAQARLRLSIPDELFTLNELDVFYSEAEEALWTYMSPAGRPSFTPTMLGDFVNWQRLIAAHFGPERVPLRAHWVLLLLRVTLVSVVVVPAADSMPPPARLLRLPVMVAPVTLTVDRLRMPPPEPSGSPAKVILPFDNQVSFW